MPYIEHLDAGDAPIVERFLRERKELDESAAQVCGPSSRRLFVLVVEEDAFLFEALQLLVNARMQRAPESSNESLSARKRKARSA